MHLDHPIPRDKMMGLITLIAITFIVLSLVTIGPTRMRFGHHHPSNGPTQPTQPTRGSTPRQVIPRH